MLQNAVDNYSFMINRHKSQSECLLHGGSSGIVMLRSVYSNSNFKLFVKWKKQ
jgi:hypothetical protein